MGFKNIDNFCILIAALIFVIIPFSSAIPDPTLRLPFDQASFNNLNLAPEGVDGTSGKFNGISDYISLPASNNLDILTHNMSWAFWMKCTNTPANSQTIMNNRAGNPNLDGWQIRLSAFSSSGKLALSVDKGDGSFGSILEKGGNICDNQWHHIVFNFKFDSRDKSKGEYYVDSVFQGSQDMPFENSSINSNSPIFIGSRDGSYNFFSGYLDEINIFNVSLSQSDISQIYANQSARLNTVSPIPQTASGPVSKWSFSENSWSGIQGEVKDSIGTNHGIAKNGANTTSFGALGRGAIFDGTNDYITIPNSASLNMTQNITVSAWFYSKQIPKPYGMIVTKSDGGQNVWEMRLDASGSKIQFIAGINGAYTFTNSNVTIQPNKWYHAVWTYNGTNAVLYLNGVQNSSVLQSGEMSIGPWNINIGARAAGAFLWNGSIDEVQIYKRALNASEVSSLYSSQLSGPISQWTFSESSWNGTIGEVKDSIGKINGTAYNGANTTADGVIGRAGKFDGVNDGVNLSLRDDGIYLNHTKSFAFWVKTNSNIPSQFIVSSMLLSSDPNGVGSGFRINYFNGYDFIAHNSTGTRKQISYTPNNLSAWHFLVGVVDLERQNMSFYVDGISVGSLNINGYKPYVNGKLSIGANGNTNSNYFNGSIDEVKIFDRALSDSEIYKIYLNGSSYLVSSAQLAYNPVSEFQLNEAKWNGTIGEVKDKYGLNNGTAKNGANITFEGIDGRAGKFDGVNDYISIPNSVSLNITKDITISAWIYAKQVPKQYSMAVTKSDGGAASIWELRQDFTGTRLEFRANINGYGTYGSSDPIQSNKWYHVVWTYNGTTAVMYLNGVQNSTVLKTGEMSLGPWNVNIGARADGVFGFWNGSIDEVLIYKRAINNSEVSNLYSGQLSRLVLLSNAGSSLSPVYQWSLNENSWNGIAGEVKDSIGINHGTAYNGANTTANGVIGRAGKFDGINDSIDLPLKDNINLNHTKSFAFWTKANSNIPSQFIVSSMSLSNDPNGVGSGFRTNYANGYDFIAHDALGYRKQISYTPNNLSAWHFLVGVVDLERHNISFYVDGNFVGSLVIDGYKPYVNGKLSIGANGNTNSNYFNGSIDEVKIFDRALNNEEVLRLYDTFPPIIYLPPSPLTVNVKNYLFNFTTNEAATCRISSINQDYDFMQIDLNGAGLTHSGIINIGGTSSENATFYIRCKDTYGNTNQNSSTIRFVYNLPPSNFFSDNTLITNTVQCSDSDDGIFSNSQGTVTIVERDWRTLWLTTITRYYSDSCVDSLKSREYFCNRGNLGQMDITCPFVCDAGSGACVGQSLDGLTTAGLVSHYKFEEKYWSGAQGEVGDSFGINHGTAYNGANVKNGLLGKAAIFDGVNDYVSIPNSNDLNIMNHDMSWAFWMKCAGSIASTQTVMGNIANNSDFRGWQVNLNKGSGMLELMINKGNFQNLEPSLKAWYQFEEPTLLGDVGGVKDSAGGIYGTAKNGANTTSNGALGRAAIFDGANDYILIPNSTSLNITKNITVSAWFYSKQIPKPYGMIVTKSDGGQNVWEMRLDASGSKIQFIAGINGAYTFTNSNVTIQPNKWYHAVWTYNGTNAVLYLNGVQNSSVLQSGEMSIGPWNINIGARAAGAFLWNGSIDEVKIFDRALNKSDVSTMYQSYISSSGSILSTGIPICDNRWHYPVFTFHYDSNNNSRVEYYLDKDFIMGKNISRENMPISSGSNLILGSYGGQSGFFKGMLDEVLIYNSKLSAGDIKQLYFSPQLLRPYLNNVASYNGDNSRIIVNNFNSNSSAITIGFWFNTNDNSTVKRIVEHGWGSGGVFTTHITDTAKVGGAVLFSNGNSGFVSSTRNINKNEWYHFVMTYDGSFLREYINGALNDSIVYNLPLKKSINNIYISGNTGVTFNGSIDEFRIYNRALYGWEVAQLYQSQKNLLGLDVSSAPADKLCGNAILDAGEQCDSYAGIEDCIYYNSAGELVGDYKNEIGAGYYTSGIVGCDFQCRIDLSQCFAP